MISLKSAHIFVISLCIKFPVNYLNSSVTSVSSGLLAKTHRLRNGKVDMSGIRNNYEDIFNLWPVYLMVGTSSFL